MGRESRAEQGDRVHTSRRSNERLGFSFAPPRQWQPEDLAVLGGLAPTAALHLHADAVSDAAQTPARLFV